MFSFNSCSTLDGLRLAFTYASNVDWKAPIRVERTCPTWRAIILSSPEVWRLDILHHVPFDRVATWITRSGDHRAISLMFPRQADFRWVDVIMPHRHRISGLRLHSHHHVLSQRFPMLETLELFEYEGPHQPIDSQIYARRFTPELYPSLQSLYISSDKRWGTLGMNPISTPVLVTKLFLESRDVQSWAPLLLSAASTVVVLTLNVNRSYSMDRVVIDFPKVVALTISGEDLPLELKTPRMTFLRLQNCRERVLSSIDVSGVTSLILDTRIPYRSHFFPTITKILIHPDTAGVLTFLRYLSSNLKNHPNLSQVLIPSECQIPDQTLNACRDQGITVAPTRKPNTMEDDWRSSLIRLAQ
jgi:hypothetical protein